MTTKISYKNIVSQFIQEDYELVRIFYNIQECIGSVHILQGGGRISNPINAIKKTTNGKIYFSQPSMGFDIIPFSMAIQNEDGTFNLYRLTYEAYCNKYKPMARKEMEALNL